MPLVSIELARGFPKQGLIQVLESLGDSITKILQLPSDDKNIRLMEYEPEFFHMKPPYQVIVQITLFCGRSIETKRDLYRSIVQNVAQSLAISQESVFIVLIEEPKENWGVRGGSPASEIQLGFEVRI